VIAGVEYEWWILLLITLSIGLLMAVWFYDR